MSVVALDLDTGYIPDRAIPFISSLVDPGSWRRRGITHWHLVSEVNLMYVKSGKRSIPNPARYSTERIRELVADTKLAAASPHEALTWLAGQWVTALNAPECHTAPAIAQQRQWHNTRAWHQALQSHWDTLTTSLVTPTGCGMATSARYSLDCYAYPQTSACRRHRKPVSP